MSTTPLGERGPMATSDLCSQGGKADAQQGGAAGRLGEQGANRWTEQ